MAVKKGDKVKVEYTGKLKDGTVFDASEKHGKPLEFEVGSGMVIKGFDQGVEGMELNEGKTIEISVDDAYGPVRPEMMQEIPRDKLPAEPEPKEGMMLALGTPDGRQIPAKIAKIADDKITIDLNHPLAGKDLTFEVKVVGINEEVEKKEDSEEKKEEVTEETVEEEEKKEEPSEEKKEEPAEEEISEEKEEPEEKTGDAEEKKEEAEETVEEEEKKEGGEDKEEESGEEKKEEDLSCASCAGCPGCH